MTQYCIKELGPRRPIGDYVSFLWGDGWDCDSDGDAKSRVDPHWTELKLINRRNLAERVDVDPCAEPLTLTVRSESGYLAARLAYALTVTTGGTLSASPEGPTIAAGELISQMGDFDLGMALDRLR